MTEEESPLILAQFGRSLSNLFTQCTSPGGRVVVLSIDDITHGDGDFLLDSRGKYLSRPFKTFHPPRVRGIFIISTLLGGGGGQSREKQLNGLFVWKCCLGGRLGRVTCAPVGVSPFVSLALPLTGASEKSPAVAFSTSLLKKSGLSI